MTPGHAMAPGLPAASARRGRLGRLLLPGWFVLSLGLVALAILGPSLWPGGARGLQLGLGIPLQALADPGGTLALADVLALPDAAFTRLDAPLSQGYTRDIYWLKATAPAAAPGDATPAPARRLWLSILPSYLDSVTLYQPGGDGSGHWQAQRSGDTVPMAQRLRVRQLMFPLREGQPFILRVQTTSPMQLDATVWRSPALLAHLSGVEWASGVHQGINFALVLLVAGAALFLRLRSLWALAAGATATLVHGALDRGYLQVWLPGAPPLWGDLAVKLGTLMLPIALSWQFRALLTQGSRWRRTDRALLALGVAPLLCLPSIPLGRYEDWAWIGVAAPWAISALFAVVAWSNLLRERCSMVNVLMAGPSTLYGVMGLYVTAAYTGLVQLPPIETSVLWQLNTLLVNIVVTVALGAGLYQRFGDAMRRQAHLYERLAKSEHALEERVRQRTAELQQTQNALHAALHGERALRQEQRQFFAMINHEFRTPLAVVDSAATEQQAFPSPETAPQVERAAQIRRACRRLMALVDNCLVSDRLDAQAFKPQWRDVPLADIVDAAAELVQWSRRHHLRLDTARAPAWWTCDPALVRIALSNLVDNAVKHARPGEITLSAHSPAPGLLALAVSDQGPGLPPEAAQHLFERYERGARAGQASGYGLGLWVARRIARLHGGDVQATPSAQGGTCFTLTLASGGAAASAGRSSFNS